MWTRLISIILTVFAALGLFRNDKKDTEELFRANVNSVNYVNTIEAAVAQTEIFSIVKEHFTSPLAEGKLTKKAIIIGYDGCRADVLTELDSQGGIALLRQEGNELLLTYCGGVNYPEKNTQLTSTGPGWCSILTGQWADKTGVTENGIPKNMEYKTLLTLLTEEGYASRAAFYTKWKGHFTNKDATYINERPTVRKRDWMLYSQGSETIRKPLRLP